MNGTDWKDIAELTALVAVVGSLIAVMIELRQTQDALQAQTYQDRAYDQIDRQLEQAKNPQLTLIFQEDFDRQNLSREEFVAAINMLHVLAIDADNEHYQYQRGFLDEGFYLGNTVREIKRWAPIWRDFGIEESRREFRDEVNRILSERPEE